MNVLCKYKYINSEITIERNSDCDSISRRGDINIKYANCATGIEKSISLLSYDKACDMMMSSTLLFPCSKSKSAGKNFRNNRMGAYDFFRNASTIFSDDELLKFCPTEIELKNRMTNLVSKNQTAIMDTLSALEEQQKNIKNYLNTD
ncbi:MAG: hypothetical protein LBI81_01940 [Puniceicoccales bacterium]|nr:hypothetical protein [Puniceicoccales bacterium]